ncbi:hypothetical protein HJFPF1_02010 [Paramyrothecium foliicola]|nr:hypothetical protein HJFPF1_02010 [Paramyrothecium foliicola]
MSTFIVEGPSSHFSGVLPKDCQQPSWDDIVDPQLENNGSPEFLSDPCWPSLPMQRFILGSSQTPQQNPSRQPAHTLPIAPGHLDYLLDLPTTMSRRGGSPSSQHRSSTCSSGQSPAGDADYYFDGLQGPSTPQDMAIASPYITANRLEHWDVQYAQSGLIEAPYSHGGGCVNPSALAPDPVVQIRDSNETDSGSNFDSMREYSFETSSSHSPYGACSSTYDVGASEPALPSHLSSTNHPLGVQDEIHVKPHLSFPVPSQSGTEAMSNSPQTNNNNNNNNSGYYHQYGGFSATKQPPRRKKNPKSADPNRRALLKRRQANNQVNSTGGSFTSNAGPNQRLLSSYNGMTQCDQCPQSFKDETLLRKHKRTEHIRPFTCIFHYAGCQSSFAAKNEWKRHVASQHLYLTYWLCTHGNCAHSKGPSTHQRSALLPSVGVMFNRKDLFTQHIRRMHSPEDKDPKTKGPSPQLEERLKAMQDDAFRKRCELPTYMRCPAQRCSSEFRGLNAWDERMEHVARHLEAAAVGEEPPVHFGGLHDVTLTRWAEADGVEVVRRTATGWETCNPLKGEGVARRASAEAMFGEDQDAEGEPF